ncbi:MAG TPA: class I SAM-dependent methyltransferase [Pyrinomonadaceae bacterium]|nr:class I SAM-dependent methyltransferase [Pyrinomonadaceae bacterium]
MAKNAAKQKADKTQSFYDRIADVHNVALKLNGYRQSVAKYLRSLDLPLTDKSYVLDAGSGTGIVTLGFADARIPYRKIVSFDLSHKSLSIARTEFRGKKGVAPHRSGLVQGNVLDLPFADGTFDLVLTCGVLEYVDLEQGLAEMSRVLSPKGKLVFIPVKPSIVGSMLEFLYKFRIHPLESVRRISSQYFNIVGNHEFPLNEPIGWSKTVFLLEKK